MIKKLLIILPILIFVALLGYGNYIFNEIRTPLNLSSETVYTVENGSSLRKVLTDFTINGWITNPKATELWLRYTDKTGIKRGDYLLTPNLNVLAVIDKIVSGDKILSSISFIEGHRFSEYLATLEADENITQTLSDLSINEIIARVDPDIEHPEGWFFPDTYLFEKGTTDLELLKISYKRMKDVLDQEWQQRSSNAAVNTPYEALILASIIEKETGAAFERPMISGVFTRRMEKRMRLQTDPTVIYGLGESFGGNLTRNHLRQDTPYNTYTRSGLPPTPIAGAGREAINAALNPSAGDSLYFVAKGDGTHYFSSTLTEHNNAVIKYQRYGRRRDDYQSAPSIETSQ